jgi:hypothetical protein
MTDRTAREKLYRSLVRKDRIGLIIGRALAKRKRNWFIKQSKRSNHMRSN